MKFYLISDNIDTATGLRLAGIEGTVVHEDWEVEHALRNAMADESVGIILMTDDLKLTVSRPLIVEIPDRHGNGRAKDSISRYVREAIGVKI